MKFRLALALALVAVMMTACSNNPTGRTTSLIGSINYLPIKDTFYSYSKAKPLSQLVPPAKMHVTKLPGMFSCAGNTVLLGVPGGLLSVNLLDHRVQGIIHYPDIHFEVYHAAASAAWAVWEPVYKISHGLTIKAEKIGSSRPFTIYRTPGGLKAVGDIIGLCIHKNTVCWTNFVCSKTSVLSEIHLYNLSARKDHVVLRFLVPASGPPSKEDRVITNIVYGKNILFAADIGSMADPSEAGEIDTLDMSTGKAEVVLKLYHGVTSLAASPSGDRIAFTDDYAQGNNIFNEYPLFLYSRGDSCLEQITPPKVCPEFLSMSSRFITWSDYGSPNPPQLYDMKTGQYYRIDGSGLRIIGNRLFFFNRSGYLEWCTLPG